MQACAVSSPIDTSVVTLRVCGWGNWRTLSLSQPPPPPVRRQKGVVSPWKEGNAAQNLWNWCSWIRCKTIRTGLRNPSLYKETHFSMARIGVWCLSSKLLSYFTVLSAQPLVMANISCSHEKYTVKVYQRKRFSYKCALSVSMPRLMMLGSKVCSRRVHQS